MDQGSAIKFHGGPDNLKKMFEGQKKTKILVNVINNVFIFVIKIQFKLFKVNYLI